MRIPQDTLILAISILLLLVLERLLPLRKQNKRFASRFLVNISMSALTASTAFFLVRPVSIAALSVVSESSIGLMKWLDLEPLLKALLTIALLDLSFYYWHMLNHRIPLLWRFHCAHHTDPDLDTTTALRFHFVEVGYSVFFRIFQVLVIGPSAEAFLLYVLIFQFAVFFHHSNLRIPLKIERLLMLVLVTPRMHGIHHSNYQSETDANYSVVFSFWDRIHKTFVKNVPQKNIIIGVPGYSKESDNNLSQILLQPFKKQRDYWLGRFSRS